VDAPPSSQHHPGSDSAQTVPQSQVTINRPTATAPVKTHAGDATPLANTPTHVKPIIGLIGGIGSGKSTVAKCFAEIGAGVIASDELNTQQLALPEVIEELVSWWGVTIQKDDSRLDRKKIASIVFRDRNERKRLEGYLHPRIAKESNRLVASFRDDSGVRAIILDSPLLLEAGLDSKCDAVVFVDANDETRLSRVIQTRGWSEEQWRSREKSQIALDKKRSRADHVVANNSSDLDELRSSVDDTLRAIESCMLQK